jgi:phosphomethylpyrimidine synthase
MKISQEVREYAAKLGVSEQEALDKGMEVKAVEFVKAGSEIYKANQKQK